MVIGLSNLTFELSENGEGVEWGTVGALKVCDFITTDEDGNYTGVIDFNDPSWDTLVNEISLEEAIAYIERNGH